MSPKSYDVAVVGAGPSGATAARLLARAGLSVALIEKRAFPRRKVCGEFISATSLPLLHDRDIRDAFAALAGPEVKRVGMFVGQSIFDSPMPAAAAYSGLAGGWGRALGRERLDLILAEAAGRAGARLWQPFKAAALKREGASYAVTIANGDKTEELKARIAVIAKGSWERDALFPEAPRPAKPSDLLAFKAHFKDTALAADLMPLLVFPGGYGGMAQSDGGRVSLSCCIRRDVLERARRQDPGGQAGEAVLRHIAVHCAGVRAALAPARRDGNWLAAGPIRPGMRTCSVDGIFFAGNMAGEAHPIIAEGISMAMQSAWLLSRRLTERTDWADPRVLRGIGEAYARDWRAAFATRIRAAAVFAHLAMQPKAALAAPLIGKFPGLLTWGAQLSGKVKQVVGGAPQSAGA